MMRMRVSRLRQLFSTNNLSKSTWPSLLRLSSRLSRPNEQLEHHGSGNAVRRAQPAVRQRLHKTRKEMHKTRQKRIPEDRHGHSDWVCHHGFHWFLRQTHSHPHQQHHCVSSSNTQLMWVVIVVIFIV